ncbi:MAG: hypothetical protein CMP98_11660 [Gammaproteobacteria bacterium]|nr:hypothetical protein [Gammaproteobacteria bacterium]OUU07976.1 MAG: hypothetical protein CBB94_11900 [Gammaproteobacteria bacterium TMED34]
MNKDFEQTVRLFAAPDVGRWEMNAYEADDREIELPRPDGRGWYIANILSVYNNPRFVQIFWEREVPEELDDDESGEGGHIIDTDLGLSHR